MLDHTVPSANDTVVVSLGILEIDQDRWYSTPARAWQYPPMGDPGSQYPATAMSVPVSDYGMCLYAASPERRKWLRTGKTFRFCGEDCQLAIPKTPSLVITNSQFKDCAATSLGHDSPAGLKWFCPWPRAHVQICALSLSVFCRARFPLQRHPARQT